ncbi:phospholipid P-type ATPase transporter [Sphaerosporella brunnea]|uniref:Phospholipid-transporting ATPase n=1 Tax=Sphaerosporella brunnea TaxID=1250544 RepID=A0A5J5ES05_9PEZI|nr:phospholipid P-type ATPase transporter [Sphaerosporella brunnea]
MSESKEPNERRSSVDGIASPLSGDMDSSPLPNVAPPPAPPAPQRRESFQRVRFSTEMEVSGGRALGLTIDTSAARNSRGPSLGVGEPVGLGIPLSPTSPRKRNRGYSLRRQLFFRNAQEQLDDGVTPEAPFDVAIAHSTSNDSVELGMLGKPSTSSLDLKKSSSGDLTELIPDHPQRRNALRDNHVSLWTRKHYQQLRGLIVSQYVTIKKAILQANELPPSRDGRRIPLDVTRKTQLIDERTGRHYLNNYIRSSRYTLWNFLPKQLYYQFSKLANFYFLCVSILQMIPTLSTTGTYTTIVPLLFFITLSISKEGYDDYRRYKLDKKENNRETRVLRTSESPDGGQTTLDWSITKWQDVRVGDIIKLERDDDVPADLLLLHSYGDHGIAYVETMALDGETNLKTKQALPVLSKQCDTTENLAVFRAEVVVEDPNLDLYNFEGKVIVDEDTRPLTNNQVIYRGSVLRNTPSMVGMVIFSGEESKIRMNANKNPRTKAPTLQAIVNRIVFMLVIFVVFLAIFNTVAYQIWRENVERKSWYLSNGSVAFFPIFASYVIMFNTLIPLSLYVSMEIIKLAQMFMLNDIDMYHEETDTPFEARTSTINEDCGQISYIFSDKTGTLTDNSMQFRKLSVGGHAWLHDLDIQRAADREAEKIKLRHKRRKGKSKSMVNKESKRRPEVAYYRYGDPSTAKKPGNTRKSMGDMGKMSLDWGLNRKDSSNLIKWKSSAVPTRPQPQFSTQDLLEYLQMHPHTLFARKARFFLLSIALCHTCIPEVDEEDESIEYQAASPDELALVTAAMELGYIAIDRQINTITIKTFPNGPDGDPQIEVYNILEVIEFSSKRKRMSILIRLPTGRICIFCKGADTTMIELLRLRELAKSKALVVQRNSMQRRSLEAQEVIRRNSTHRPNIGGRPSFGGPSRPSMSIPRLRPIKDEFDAWLRDKEESVDMASQDDESLYSRPSGQFAARHSIAFGEAPNMPLERDYDDDEIVDEELALDDAKVFERCFAHIDHFATEGLRTLLYAHRFIEEHEYQMWKNIYAEATTSLVDRKTMIERAAEIIERDFELTGATAIEDKLQKGVPESIDKLRRAGIKLWMLTGDKRETAINIGHSCRLIKDYSAITILHQDDVSIAGTIKSAIFDIKAQRVAHSVVVVDGGTLSMIESNEELKSLFFDIAVLTDSVICCRASPSQKASLVKAIRTKVQKSVTLAIGDGANDIAMIQEAHVGVGITGKEGLQAARVSDYSMAQFRFLLKFLLVHGRWNYVRITRYTVATFWKEMLFYLTQAMYQRWNGYTGSSLYEPWTLSMFNTLFTSLPVIFLGIFEKDLQPATLLAVPELYNYGQHNRGFNFWIYLGWMFLSTSQAMLIYFLMYQLYAPRIMVDQGVYAMGTITYGACITLISTKLQVIEMHNKSFLAAVSFICSVGGFFLWNIILSFTYTNFIHNVKWSFTHHFGRDLSWWLVFFISIAVCVLFDILLITVRNAFWPTDVNIFQEIEQDSEMRKRLEEAASEELQQGLNRDSKIPRPTSRETEVMEILDRPREMEEGWRMRKAEEDVEANLARRFGSVKRR